MDTLRAIALTILIIGAINWGLIGLFNIDLVQAIFGGTTTYSPSLASRIVYLLVGLSGLYAFTFYRMSEDSSDKVEQKS
ncbi:MAG TPA: DUF378 domain-containing protein [Firmicutes bacterium]|nr:DUF378 domain-containing protein [Bacillota bacterium]